MTTDVSLNSRRAFQVEAVDNVATLLQNVEAGPVSIYGTTSPRQIQAHEPIALGHKIALAHVNPGEPIVKYGVTIGVATAVIAAGEWVHLHNCRSQMDERSNHLDPKTGAAKDTPYA